MKRTQHKHDEEAVGEKFAHKKSLGQNFLTSDVVPNWLVAAGGVTAGDTILEIGPGTGALTKILLKTGAKVIALEADTRAITILEPLFTEEIKTGQLTLIHGDARELSISALGLAHQQFKVVANIPYYLSGFLLRTLLENPIQPSKLVFLMQKEVVNRIARDTKESILSLSVKAFGVPKYVKTVTRGHFNPPPKVDSAILLISDISLDNFSDTNEQNLYFELLHLGFGQKRKQMLSNLAHSYDRSTLERIFTELGLKLDIRAETVPLSSWLTLTKKLAVTPKLHSAN
ncbi:16S rRNA (adenine(1518)-N(6)/adenine(1519)-N(6))-dimethyltransferase RsmA [Patescibacteria group bacterium]|nr:16S rRNA (adenine(1518)-N(6)/adenine(1519)-N(6))-dimethyltransferase RsmA [Patescibacteria group bacterium]